MVSADKVMCSRGGHPRRFLGQIDYRAEDRTVGPLPEDFAPGDPRRDEEPMTLFAGAVVMAGPGVTRELRPQGGSKSRFHCRRCGLSVPVSWDALNRRGVARELTESGQSLVELSELQSMLSS